VPIEKAWDPLIPGQCIDLVKFNYGLQIPNIVTGIAILILPVPVIVELGLNKETKFSLIALFTVGGLSVDSVQKINSAVNITFHRTPIFDMCH
jgi:hypothetical protein